MQGQIGGVNGFVVIIFVHYILSDKVVLELESRRGWHQHSFGGAGIVKIAAFGSSYGVGVGAVEGCDLLKR